MWRREKRKSSAVGAFDNCKIVDPTKIVQEIARELWERYWPTGGEVHIANMLPLLDCGEETAREIFLPLLECALEARSKTETSDAIVGSLANGHGVMFSIQSTNRTAYIGNPERLAQAKAAVLRVGGKLWINEKTSSGSTVYFTIPIGEGANNSN